MSYFDSAKYSRSIAHLQWTTTKGIKKYLNRYGLESQVTRLTQETETKLDRYAMVVGKDKMLVNQKNKAVNKTTTFNMRLAVLNSSFYNIHNPTYEEIEVIYQDNLIRQGDTVVITVNGLTLTYTVNNIPKTYYNACWQCILAPLSRETEAVRSDNLGQSSFVTPGNSTIDSNNP